MVQSWKPRAGGKRSSVQWKQAVCPGMITRAYWFEWGWEGGSEGDGASVTHASPLRRLLLLLLITWPWKPSVPPSTSGTTVLR